MSTRKIVIIAIKMMEELGELKFSIRKLATKLDCDPMTIQYYFNSREGLEKAMLEELIHQFKFLPESSNWDDRLVHIAWEYRKIALSYPITFQFMHKYLSSGTADYAQAQYTYKALIDAGLNDRQVVDLSLAFYSLIIGLASAEVGGLLRAVNEEDADIISRLPSKKFALTQKLVPVFKTVKPGEVFEYMISMFVNGIKTLGPIQKELSVNK